MAKRINFRSDSVLGNLPEDRQTQVAQWIMDCKEGDRYEYAVEQLAADGIKVGRTAVFEWFRGWRLRQRMLSADSLACKVQDALKSLKLGLTAEQLSEAGQAAFQAEALAAENAEEFREMEYLRLAKQTAQSKAELEKAKLARADRRLDQKDQDLALSNRKFQRDTCELFLKWSADEKAKSVLTSGATNAEKIEALGRAMFGEEW